MTIEDWRFKIEKRRI